MADGVIYPIRITADDATGKGVASAERRIGGVLKRTANDSRSAAGEIERNYATAARGIIRTFAGVQGSLGSALGSGGGGLINRLSALAGAGNAVGEGLGAAAVSGGLLTSSMATMGVVGAATVATIGAVAFATDKLVTGWAKGVAGSARFAATIGVSTRALQEFRAAGERVGVSQESSGGALAGLSGSLYNAKWGRNSDALAVLTAMGVKMQLDKNGNPDTEAMLPAIADALAKQDPRAAIQAGAALGISPDALPLFRQGGAAMRGAMADASRHAMVTTPDQDRIALEWQRKRAMAGQLAQREWSDHMARGARRSMPGLDAVLGIGTGGIDGGAGGAAHAAAEALGTTFPRAATVLHEGAKMLRDVLAGAGAGTAASGTLAQRIERLGERSPQGAVSPKGARGVMQLMPDTARRVARQAGENFDEGLYLDKGPAGEAYNRHLGSLEVARLARKYGGDAYLVAAAYNAGDGRLDGRRGRPGWLSTIGDPRTGAISDEEFAARIPFRETREYAQRVGGGGGQHVHHHHHHVKFDGRRLSVRTSTEGSSRISHTTTGDGF